MQIDEEVEVHLRCTVYAYRADFSIDPVDSKEIRRSTVMRESEFIRLGESGKKAFLKFAMREWDLKPENEIVGNYYYKYDNIRLFGPGGSFYTIDY